MSRNLFEETAYDIDMVFCLDMTGNVQGLSQVREGLSDLYNGYIEHFSAEGCGINSFRVKYVLFRDYRYDEEPMVESMFFDLATEMDEAFAFADGSYPGGGGDLRENALEAFSIAMDSDWNNERRHHRQIIVLVTDSLPLPLCEEGRVASPCYPMNMPKNLDALHEKWDSLGRRKRLFLFAPSEGEWLDMCEWDNVFLYPVQFGANCCDIDIVPELVKLII